MRATCDVAGRSVTQLSVRSDGGLAGSSASRRDPSPARIFPALTTLWVECRGSALLGMLIQVCGPVRGVAVDHGAPPHCLRRIN